MQLLTENLFFVFAEVFDNAIITIGLAGLADISTVKNQPVMCAQHKLLRCGSKQAFFHFQYGFAFCDAGAVGNPVDMRINRDSRMTECCI